MVDSFLEQLPWIILFAPLLAAALITFFFQKSPKTSGALALTGILTSFAGSVWLFIFHTHNHFLPAETSWAWIQVAGLTINFGFLRHFV